MKDARIFSEEEFLLQFREAVEFTGDITNWETKI